MPRFFFEVREGTRFVPDNEGMDFTSVDAAEREAAEAAASIGRDHLPKGDGREITVEVLNEHRQRIITVMVSMTVDRVDPQPVAPAG